MNYSLYRFNLAAQRFSNILFRKLLNLRNRDLFVCDVILFVFTPLLALIIRLDGDFSPQEYMRELVITTILFLSVKLILFWSLGFYKRYWRYASIEELIYIGMLVVAAVIMQNILFDVFYYLPYFTLKKLPHSLPFIDGLLSFIFIGGLRFSVRAVAKGKGKPKAIKSGERVLVVGAGYAGVALVQEMQRNPQLGFYPVAYIDDNPEKINLKIAGIPVVGNRWQIPEFVQSLQIQKVVIAMPTVSGKVIREIVDLCKSTGIQTSTLPGVHQILNGRVRVDAIRDVRIEDLLRRECVETDIEKVASFLKGKKVLVTGAGGSIGSELCRQIFNCCPAEMIMVGHGENSVFNIQQELEQLARLIQQDSKVRKHTPAISAFIADIRFASRLKEAFKQFKPDVIFHAAAHKHVPLMEMNAAEAITNNVLGTKNLLDLAKQYNVENFIMISTDKAVNPTNIMGASKRVAEMLVLQAARDNNKPYNVVRFGNVLGSRGSVVPTFKKQIAAGGPVTVTHPEIRRYFMTIPEAVQLVLQASVLGRVGELLMLNMGEPVKIVDLAAELIRLSGYEVNKDIEIVFTGLRPGEKLFEELFIPGEEYKLTQHEKLLVVKNASLFIPQNLEVTVEKLRKAAEVSDAQSIVCLLEQIVPGYKPKTLSDRLFTADQNNSQHPQNRSIRFTSQSQSSE